MTTIVNTPATTTDSNNGMGFVIGVILLLVFAFLFFVYGLPAISRTIGTASVNVPDKINVNVQTPNSGK